MRFLGVIVVIILVVAVLGKQWSAADKAAAVSLDQTIAAVSSCSFNDMLSATEGIPTVSGNTASAICNTMYRSLGHNPPMNVLRAAFKTISMLSIRGKIKDPEPDIAYQLMNVVEARGITDPDRIMATFDVVFRIAVASGGHVAPRDLNVMLRSAGPAAHTLSDDGLVSMAALLWEQKKATGR